MRTFIKKEKKGCEGLNFEYILLQDISVIFRHSICVATKYIGAQCLQNSEIFVHCFEVPKILLDRKSNHILSLKAVPLDSVTQTLRAIFFA
jgi:hypothetical protein